MQFTDRYSQQLSLSVLHRASRVVAAALACAAVCALSAPAAAATVPQSPMTSGRSLHVADYFTGVGVVVTGGWSTSGAHESVDLFTPDTNTWSSLGPAPVGPWDAGAVVLADGRWLVLDALVGLVYDPATDTWDDAPALAESFRDASTLSLLPDGDVLIAGGWDKPKTSLRYDPTTATIVATANLIKPRGSHTATRLPDGRVLLAGGWTWGYSVEWDTDIQEPLAVTEAYDPLTDTWTALASMATRRERHGAALLPSGKVLVAGGRTMAEGTVFSTTNTAELFDPATNSWSPAAPLNAARLAHTMTALPSGHVIVAGGSGTGGRLASVEVYDPATDTWTLLDPMSQPRWNHTATYIPNHGVLIVGGSTSGTDESTASVDLITFGHATTGTACVLADECASGLCVDGLCAEPSGDDDGEDEGEGEDEGDDDQGEDDGEDDDGEDEGGDDPGEDDGGDDDGPFEGCFVDLRQSPSNGLQGPAMLGLGLFGLRRRRRAK